MSDLALVLRPRDGSIEGFVLEANSGEPVAEAEVTAWRLDNQGKRITRSPLSTDENGFFSFQASQGQNHLFRVRHNGRELGTQQDYSAYDYEGSRAFDQTIFFTDRALYRPGQIIQYKGICLHVNQEKDNYEVLARRAVTVALVDPNGKNVAEMRHQCNDYGSFSGSFTAPRDRSLGRYQIQVITGPPGESGFNIEEYKRPKFQVSLDPPKAAAKLNDKVLLAGRALSYTGAAVDGAKVVYRVVREVRWPDWWGWYSWRQTQIQASQETAHGFVTTEADGSFKIQFLAKPDPKVSEQDGASFSFSIYADVTDAAGETRSAQRGVNVGFTALRATLAAAEWQTAEKSVELNIRTTTLDDEPQAAEGSLKIYRLKQPAQVQRPPQAGPGYWGYQTKGEKEDLSNPNNWPLGEVVEERGFATDARGEAAILFKLGVGAYRAMLETQDRFGKKVAARLPLQVLEPADTKLAISIPHLLAAPAWSIEPGAEFAALWGTGYDGGRAFIEIEHRRQMIKRYWTNPGRTQQQIKQAVTEEMRGGFTLHVTRVRENRAYLESRHIEVPWSNKDLEIKWEHFTSKLEPGGKETWTAVIQTRGSKSEARRRPDGKDGAKGLPSPPTHRGGVGEEGQGEAGRSPELAIAEMVASLYDRSLDQFMAHSWPERFSFFRQDYSIARPSFENTAKQFQWIKGQWEQRYQSVDLRHREFPPDLAANYRGYEFQKSELRGLDRQPFGLASTEAARRDMKLGAPVVVTGSRIPSAMEAEAKNGAAYFGADKRDGERGAPLPPQTPDLSQVTARKNLSETAFFFPQLVSDSNGVVRMTFTMPEALTEWKFMGFAHDRACRCGYLEGKTVTAKEVMVEPNPPRFLREGDLIEFTVKVSNQTTNRQTGKVRLTFGKALTGESANGALDLRAVGMRSLSPSEEGRIPDPSAAALAKAGVRERGNRRDSAEPPSDISFEIPAKESRSYSWRIKVPDGAPFLTYKAVAAGGSVSDGEEGFLPVLSRRILVTESIPLPIRGPAT